MAIHDKAELITAYWRETMPECKTKRTAQHHAKNNHPKWIAWLATTSLKVHDPKAPASAVTVQALGARLTATGPPIVEVEAPAPPAVGKPIDQRTPEEHAECEAWEMFTKNCAAAKRHADTDSITAAGFSRIACQCLAAYHLARAKRVQSDIENQRLLPVSEYDALCNDGLKVAGLWKNMMPDLASQIDPVNPLRLLRLFENYIETRINPALEKFVRSGELPALAA